MYHGKRCRKLGLLQALCKKIGYIRPKPKYAGKVKKINHLVEVSKLTQPATQSNQNPYQNPDSKGAKSNVEQPS